MRVSEVFQSWQGEYPAGVPMLFVRLQGCNRRCDWCDTKYAQDPEGGKEMHWRDVLRTCRAWGGPVCFTGGEPMLQLAELQKVVRRLQDVYIETNGDIDPGMQLRGAKLVVSPKDWKVARRWVHRRVVLKFVVDIEKWQDFVTQYRRLPRGKALCLAMPLTEEQDGPATVFRKCLQLVDLINEEKLTIGYVCRQQRIFGYR